MCRYDVKLIWHEKKSLHDLHDFCVSPAARGNFLYFWIYKSSIVRYIGETSDVKKRFKEHLPNILHGLYSTINEYDQSRRDVTIYGEKWEFEKIAENIDAVRSYIISCIMSGVENLKNMNFIFANIAEIKKDGKIDESRSGEVRKHIEAIFILNCANHAKGYNVHPFEENKTYRSNNFIFGNISRYPIINSIYALRNDFASCPETKGLLEKVGLADLTPESVDVKYQGKGKGVIVTRG